MEAKKGTQLRLLSKELNYTASASHTVVQVAPGPMVRHTYKGHTQKNENKMK